MLTKKFLYISKGTKQKRMDTEVLINKLSYFNLKHYDKNELIYLICIKY